MNTCAECRFWNKDVEAAAKGVCELLSNPSGMHMPEMAFVSAPAFLMTRSDFGCVQFEQKAVDLKGIPVALNVFDRESMKPINALDINLDGLTGVEVAGDSRSALFSSVSLRFGKDRKVTLVTDDRDTFDALANWASRLLYQQT